MKKIRIELKWAVIFVLMQLLWMLLEKLTGLHGEHIDKHAIFTNFIAIPAIVIYVLALLDKRNNYYNGNMTYIQGFFTGLIITAIVTVFVPLTQYLTSTVISPDYFTNATMFAVENEEMTQTSAEQYFTLKNYIFQGIVGTILMGTVTTVIIAIFTKKKSSGA